MARDALVIAFQSDIGNLNPIVYETAADSAVLVNIFEPIIDNDFECSLTYTPGLYASWTFSEDGTEIRFTLRDDIMWSDGQPVTAHDIAYAYELVADPKVASPRMAYIENLAEGYPKVEDNFAITFKFTHEYDHTTMLAHASLGYLPKHVFADADRQTLRGHPRSLDPLVSGPFRLKLHEKGSRFVLEANDAYTGPQERRPMLKRVVFDIIPEYATRLIKLTHGEVDLMEGLNIEDVDRIKVENPEIKIMSRGYRFSDYVGWNTEKPLFADPEVRRALTMAMDIDDMMAKLLTGSDGTVYAKKSVSTVTPELCDAHANDIDLLPFDRTASKEILASKGWTDTDGDGWIDKDGKPFSFTLTTNSGNKRRADSAILIQAHLKEIGVQVNLEQRESNTFFESLRKRDYEAALAGWSAALFVDPSDVWGCDTPELRREFNFTGYCNPEVEALITKGLTTPDTAAQAPIWREMQAKIYADQPYTFLWWREELVGLNSRFEHVGMDVLSLLNDLHDWEVPPDKVKYPR